MPQQSIPTDTESRIGLDNALSRADSNFREVYGRYHSLDIMRGYQSATLPPPLDAARWHNDEVTVFSHEDLLDGDRISPVRIYHTGGQYLMLYQGDTDDPDSDASVTTRIAVSPNGVDWQDAAVILDDPDTGTWEGDRQRGSALIYDTTKSKWVLVYGGNGHTQMPGRRGSGIAYADSIMGPWTKFAGNPILTVDTADLSDWAPTPLDAAYAMSTVLVDGTYYMLVMAGDRSTSNYKIGVLTATDPEGPWSGGAHNPMLEPGAAWENGFAWAQTPTFVESEQKWYVPYYNQSGGIGFAISDNSDLLSPWSKHPDQVITVPDGSDGMQPQVWPMPGGNWACFAAVEDAASPSQGAQNSLIRMVTSHIPPTRFKRRFAEIDADLAARLQTASNLSDLSDASAAIDNLISNSATRKTLWQALIPHLPTSDPGQSYAPWRDTTNDTLRISPPVTPTISGTAYPAETLTSDDGAGDWYVDGVLSESGSTTFVVPVDAVGADVTVIVDSVESNPTTIWHPTDIASVQAVYLANVGTLNTTGPDEEAEQNEEIVQWSDQSASAYHLTASGTQTPRKRVDEITGHLGDTHDVVRAEAGEAQWMDFPAGGALDIMRNVSHGYAIVGVRDFDPTGGGALRYAVDFTTPGGGVRFGLVTKVNSTNTGLYTRLTDAGSATLAEAAQPSGMHVLTGHGDWQNGTTRLRINGSEVDTTAMGASGSTDDTASSGASIFNSPTDSGRMSGEIAAAVIVSGNTALTATELSELERYVGLLIGEDIPLV